MQLVAQQRLVIRLFGLGCGQGVGGEADELADPVPVLQLVACDVEVEFRTRIGGAFILFRREGLPCFGGFQKELIIADRTDEFAITIDAKLAKHFPCGNRSGFPDLLEDIVNGFLS